MVGHTQYDYIGSLGPKLTEAPLRLLIQYVDKWDYNNTLHPNNDEAILREVDRQRWRQYYHKRAIFMLLPSQKTNEMPLDAPITPADASNPALEPQEVEEFLLLMQLTFMPSPHTCLSDITYFSSNPAESIEDLSNRFEDIAFPLLHAGVMTTRGLTVLLHRHLPIDVRVVTIATMQLEDERRMKTGEALIDLGELLLLAHEKENNCYD